MSYVMKIFLENRGKYSGTTLHYPYKREKGRFEVSLCNKSIGYCCITYAAKRRPFGNGEEKEIGRICKENKMKHCFDSQKNTLTLLKVPVNEDTFHALTEIDMLLGLPIGKLDKGKLFLSGISNIES